MKATGKSHAGNGGRKIHHATTVTGSCCVLVTEPPILHGPDIIGSLSGRGAVGDQQYGFAKASEQATEGGR